MNIKLVVYKDKRVLIENYHNLLDLNDEVIKVDIYTIIGNYLKIVQMDSYIIEITGNINQVLIEG